MSDRPERPGADPRSAPTDPPGPESAPAETADRNPAASSVPSGEPAEAAAHDYPELTAPAEEAARATPFSGPAATAPLDEPGVAAARPREPGYRGLALGLAAALLIALGLVGTAPFWSPLVPWGEGRAGVDPAIVERLDAEQQQIGRLDQQIATVAAALPRLEQRIGALEQKPAPASPDLGDMRQQVAAASAGMSDLATRLDRLENAAQYQTANAADLKTGLEQLGRTAQSQAAGLADLASRLDRAEQAQQTQGAGLADLASRLDRAEQARQAQAADLAARLGPLQQGLQTQQSAAAELRSYVQDFEKAAQSRAGDLTDMGLTLALLQIRNAVEAGRPFPAEYETLSSLAKTRPDIAAAAAPLAGAAPSGIADRATLARDLHALAQRIDTAPDASGTGDGWTGAALDRLRGLVRIRRADEADPGRQAEAAVTIAERALAGGDLGRAVAAVETLQGPAAASASDWLGKARERLAVEAALHRLDALLTARLGNNAALPGSPG